MTKLLPENVKNLNQLLLVSNPDENSLISLIIQNIPEWKRLVGCKQHNIHDFTLDVHTLLVIKKIKEHTEFHILKEEDKLLLLYAALLHDIAKNENEFDPTHPQKGADKALNILCKLEFSENFINRVCLLINHHQVLGLIVGGKKEVSSQDLAAIYSDTGLLELQAILAIADIKSVKKDEAFFSEPTHGRIKEIVNNAKIFI